LSTLESSSASPWLESQRRSRARRFAANRARRRRWSGRTGAGVLLASLTLAAGGAFASGTTGGSSYRSTSSASTTIAVQRALGITADGIYGPQTRRAVRRFQRRHHLIVDGIVGPQTLGALGIKAGSGSRGLAVAPSRPTSTSAILRKIALCESGGNPRAISPGGRYRGKYQFSRATWRALGGHGDPARASEATQDAMAAKLLAQRGTSPWPSCA
jgi:peptidoglycan hydrolase-like protein with peptidoglycan-binding domain